jgi:CHAD domain-containing protein
MGYTLVLDETVTDGVRRVVAEQIDGAIASIDDPETDRHDAVHDVRKRMKRIRAVLRLVRPVLTAHDAEENAFFRDTARALSVLRDAQSVLEALDDLVEDLAADVDREPFRRVRAGLVARCDGAAGGEETLPERLADARARLDSALGRIADWTLDAHGYDAVEGGLAKTYGRARRRLEEVRAEPDRPDEAHHEWRKRVKDHRYHMRLLAPLWGPVLEARRAELHRLTDLLGDDHDLVVLRERLVARPEEHGGAACVEAVLERIAPRSAALRREARPLGRRLFAEKPRRLADRFRTYWQATRDDEERRETWT